VIEEVVEEEIIEEEPEELFADTKVIGEVREEREEEKSKKKDKKSKVKVITEYEIVITDFVFNSDGTQEPLELKLKVKDWKLREDESGGNPFEVYQLELDTNKGPVYVYLSSSRKITKVDCGEVVYLMRGL